MNQRLRRPSTSRFKPGQRRHRLRPAPRARAAEEGEERRRRRRLQADRLRRVREVRREVRREHGVQALRRGARPAATSLAQLYADPKIKVMSFWTMGFNQHTRGVWANHMVYNLHLLTGKISTPGNSPFSLTGQPSACGTAREVGVFSHRLPADMVVTNPKHRAMTEEIWKLPPGTIPGEARLPRRAAEPDAEGRPAQLLLDADHQQRAGRRQLGAGDLAGLPQSGQLHRRLRRVSDRHHRRRRPDPARAPCGWRRRAPSATPSGAPQFWQQLVNAPGEARSDLWQIMEFSKRFKMEEVWPAELLAKKPEYRGKTLYDVLFANGEVDKFPDFPAERRVREPRSQGASASTCRRACSRSTRSSAAATATTSRRSTPTTRCAACAGRW